MSVELIANVIPASPNSNWEPKHTKARIEKTKIRHSEKTKAADYRRAVVRREILGKVVAHNMRVKTVAKKSKKPSADQQIANLIAAENRRVEILQKELQRLASHHNKVRALAAKKTSSPPSPVSEKVKNAEIRRESLRTEQKTNLQAHHQKVLGLLNQWRSKKPESDEATSALISAASEVMKKEEAMPVETTEVSTEVTKPTETKKSWVPKHTKARIEKPKIRDQDRLKAADYRRAVNRRAVLSKVVAHNAKVKAVAKKISKKKPATAVIASQKAASERRERMQQETIEKLSDHHKKVEQVAAAKKNITSDAVIERVEQASQRRESRLNGQKESLNAHHEKVTTTLQKWRESKKEDTAEQQESTN